MPLTLDQVDTYHAERGNSEWAGITEEAKRQALLLKALDYVEANYAPLIEDAEEHPRYRMAVSLLALRLSQKPNTDVAEPVIKKRLIEAKGVKKDIEYFEPASLDPFPGVTKLMESLKLSVAAPSIFIGRMTR